MAEIPDQQAHEGLQDQENTLLVPQFRKGDSL